MKNFTLATFCLIQLTLSACTGQLLDSFRYQQAQETFQTQAEINTKVDILWVVDNSASMDVVQKNLRDKLAGFANTYLSPSWDIQIGVITTDAYLSHAAFQSYLTTSIAGSVGYKSKHIEELVQDRQSRGLNLGNDSKQQALDALGVNLTTDEGSFDSGFSYSDMVPAWGLGADYARLLPGVRDGPISALCFEVQPLFLIGNDSSSSVVSPNCGQKDASDSTGTASCLNPSGSQNSVEECVNTTLNDTVRSGSPIIQTRLPSRDYDRSAWTEELIDKFSVNISVGTTGGGSERGLSSVLQFLEVNEVSDSQFFRKGSVRGVIFLADEDDQSMEIPEDAVGIYSPFEHYACDLDALEAANADKFADARDHIANVAGFCCAGSSCRYEDTGCSAKTVDGQDFTTGICADESRLLDVSSFRDQLVNFFYELDEVSEEEVAVADRTSAGANFFVASIVPTKATTINSMRAERNESTDRLDSLEYYSGSSIVTRERIRQQSVDYGKRYIEAAELTGNGSLALDIGEPDYGVILDEIGRTLVSKRSTFQLRFAPTQKADIILEIQRENGNSEIIAEEDYEFEGKTLTITNIELVLSLSSEDNLFIDYQPSSLD